MLRNVVGDTPNIYLYTGEQFDPDLGMYFLRARYLNPETGRFHTMDTFEGVRTDPQSLHKYLYAHANPVINVDPSGQSIVGAMVGFVVAHKLASLSVIANGVTAYAAINGHKAMQTALGAQKEHFSGYGAPYGGAFRHCVAANELVRRFTRPVARIMVLLYDKSFENPDDPNDLGDMYGEQIGLAGATSGLSSAEVCLEEFPSPPIKHLIIEGYKN